MHWTVIEYKISEECPEFLLENCHSLSFIIITFILLFQLMTLLRDMIVELICGMQHRTTEPEIVSGS